MQVCGLVKHPQYSFYVQQVEVVYWSDTLTGKRVILSP